MSESEQLPVEPERPEWLPDKFKSAEDLARSYSEAEQRLIQLQQQVDQEREQFSQALQNMEELTSQQQQRPYNPNEDPLIQQFSVAVENGDAQAMLAIQLELNRQITQQAIQESLKEYGGRLDRSAEVDREMAVTMATERVAREYQDWDNLAPKIGAFLQENPGLIPENNSIDSFEKALRLGATVVMAQEGITQQRVVEDDRQMKLSTQGLQGQGARMPSPEEQAAEWDRVKNIQLGGYADLYKK